MESKNSYVKQIARLQGLVSSKSDKITSLNIQLRECKNNYKLFETHEKAKIKKYYEKQIKDLQLNLIDSQCRCRKLEFMLSSLVRENERLKNEQSKTKT